MALSLRIVEVERKRNPARRAKVSPVPLMLGELSVKGGLEEPSTGVLESPGLGSDLGVSISEELRMSAGCAEAADFETVDADGVILRALAVGARLVVALRFLVG